MKHQILYAIPITQKELIEKYCFNSRYCGQIIVGGQMIGNVACFPCRKKDCKYEEKNMKVGINSLGDIVYIRKLKEEQKCQKK